ncbi:MAG: thermonuclease family protein [Caulobacter sp.]|nr:thermonuclease family protein [Caulobacter sp.]
MICIAKGRSGQYGAASGRRAATVLASWGLGALLSVLAATVSLAETVTGKVVAVADGDTLTLLTASKAQLRIRLGGIDAPESGQAWGSRSRTMLREMTLGRQARLVVTDRDRYGRLVARVYVGSTDVNAEMVRRGGAWAYLQHLTDRALLRHEAAAWQGRLGLWALPPRQLIAPWQWRASQRSLNSAAPDVALAGGQAVTCGAKQVCRQMTSCAEARAYLRQCRVVSLDGDGDGVPCNRLCRRGGR